MGALFTDWPLPQAFGVLFVIILLRANATYWLGRAARGGAAKTRVKKLMQRPGYQRAEALAARWGPIAVTLSFLTIGLQTLINLAAGTSRMPYGRYLPAMIVGGVMWALMYATIGALSVQAWFQLYQRWPALAIGILAVLALGVASFIIAQLRRRAASAEQSPDNT